MARPDFLFPAVGRAGDRYDRCRPLHSGPISLNYLMAPPVPAVILPDTCPALILLGLGSTSILVLGLTG
jgi:hypothetical protein